MASSPLDASPMSGGHINDSWHIRTQESSDGSYLLQRINDYVFVRPGEVMENIERVTNHLRQAAIREGNVDVERAVLSVIRTTDGHVSWMDEEGATWRMLPYIEQTVSRLQPGTADQAYEAARMFGRFQRLLADYEGPRLFDTIVGFHDTPKRLDVFKRAVKDDTHKRCRTAGEEIKRIISASDLAKVLMIPYRAGEIPERIVHNDAKISNVLFDSETGEGLCVIDLDTVMPGLSLFDFGDMIRSMSCFAAEDETDLSLVSARPDFFEAITAGYLDEMSSHLVNIETRLLMKSAQLITYEQALRFLTDFLQGDSYYKTSRPSQNLDRCRVQLALLDSLCEMEERLG